ncbi:MAG: 4-hydroxy-3-methylbut-2-enyl diphosphate reductase [bacterium]|nr:4-hydroxy-3-methylbut-2-enyl diphosphate reductase [bacterium]
MEIILAREYGFCFGVRRAISLAEEALKSGKHVASLGPIIHNPLEVSRLESIGLRVIEDISELREGESILIRSHGVPLEIIQELKDRGIDIIDATCPLVARAQRMVDFLTSEGYRVIIAGEQGHPEVKGLVSYGKNNASVVSTLEEIPELSREKIGIVGQTTFSLERFREIVGEVVSKSWEVRIFNTLCDASRKRQLAVEELVDKTDAIIVIGGRNSANTRRLVDIALSKGATVYHIESWDEVLPEWFIGKDKIGITAGASTPDWVIDKVLEKIRELCYQ